MLYPKNEKNCNPKICFFRCGDQENQNSFDDYMLLEDTKNRKNIQKKHNMLKNLEIGPKLQQRINPLISSTKAKGKISIKERKDSLQIQRMKKISLKRGDYDITQSKSANNKQSQSQLMKQKCNLYHSQQISKTNSFQYGNFVVLPKQTASLLDHTARPILQQKVNQTNLMLNFNEVQKQQKNLECFIKLRQNLTLNFQCLKGHTMRLGQNLPTLRSVMYHTNAPKHITQLGIISLKQFTLIDMIIQFLSQIKIIKMILTKISNLSTALRYHFTAAKATEYSQKVKGIFIKNQNLCFYDDKYLLSISPMYPQLTQKGDNTFGINSQRIVMYFKFTSKDINQKNNADAESRNRSFSFKYSHLAALVGIQPYSNLSTVIIRPKLESLQVQDDPKAKSIQLTLRKPSPLAQVDIQKVPIDMKFTFSYLQYRVMHILLKKSLFDLSGMQLVHDIKRMQDLGAISNSLIRENSKIKSQIDQFYEKE